MFTRVFSRWAWWMVVGSAALCGCRAATQPTPASGGVPTTLDAVMFAEDVEPILQRRGCSDVACHGGQGSGELMLSGGLNVDADLLAVSGLTTPWDPHDSPLLLKPLAEEAGGYTHGGGTIFASEADPDYQTMLRWLMTEEFIP